MEARDEIERIFSDLKQAEDRMQLGPYKLFSELMAGNRIKPDAVFVEGGKVFIEVGDNRVGLTVTPGWIPATESMPADSDDVLVAGPVLQVDLGYRELDHWCLAGENRPLKESQITHWMPLPDGPE